DMVCASGQSGEVIFTKDTTHAIPTDRDMMLPRPVSGRKVDAYTAIITTAAGSIHLQDLHSFNELLRWRCHSGVHIENTTVLSGQREIELLAGFDHGIVQSNGGAGISARECLQLSHADGRITHRE